MCEVHSPIPKIPSIYAGQSDLGILFQYAPYALTTGDSFPGNEGNNMINISLRCTFS